MVDMPLTSGRVAGVEFTVLGDGGPVTVFAHGLGGTSGETRPLALKAPAWRATSRPLTNSASVGMLRIW